MKFAGQILFLLFVVGSIFASATYIKGTYLAREEQAAAEVNDLKEGIAALEDRISFLKASNPQVGFPENIPWKATGRSEAELQLQDAVMRIIDKTGIASRILGGSGFAADVSRDTIAFEFEGSATLPQMYRFLNFLEAHSPRIALGALHVRRAGQNAANQTEIDLLLRVTLWAIWEESAS
ncbi:FtsB/FtsL family cell division protein [Thalassococcus lentus]|uniref:Type II secretion system (T2SS), protein M subtype b n=1 Tax=Thalassococcus lentus TaxID=1210524 RepID=A0ABT4XUH4_9RHOB|nr:hypothetical protein [Thalassococcus lentus]MDA7425617.1 hypothetical protein [Thalassococcus lentus]